jgi:tetratricopeptide (TPR) repeat protein
MDSFITHRRIGGLKAYRRLTVTVIIASLFIKIFVGNQQQVYAAAPNEAIKISETTSTEAKELSQRIKQLVKELEYSDKIAEDFAKMVMSWKDEQGRTALVVYKLNLDETKENCKQGKISKNGLAKVEENIAKQLSLIIKRKISPGPGEFFDLIDVIKYKQAQCVSYSQILYVLGNSIGLSIETINVLELINPSLSKREIGHMACMINLANGLKIMVDLTSFPKLLISKPFELKKQFTEKGNYWELKEKDNLLEVHRKIRILDKNGLIASIYYNRGSTYSELEYDKAVHNYNQAIQLDPNSADAYYNRGTLYGQSYNYSKALSDLTRTIELNPEFAEAYVNRGITYCQLGRYTEAIADYTHAIELEPKNGNAYFNRGNTYYTLENYTEAILDYNKSIKINPNYTEAYFPRGNVYYKLGQHAKAISDYTKAIETNPENAEAYNKRGIVYSSMGQYTKALSDFNRAIELNPKHAEAYTNRGVIYSRLTKYNNAISDFNKSIELNPKNSIAYCNRGYAYQLLNEPNKAIYDYTNAVEIDSEYAEGYYYRGSAYASLSQCSEAISDYNEAIKLNPDYAEAFAARGSTCAFLGESEKAKKDLLKAVELKPALEAYVKKICDKYKLNLQLD